MNYTGEIDGDDYFTMDQAFLNQNATWNAPSAVTAAVPERASLTLLAFAGSMLLSRRRK